MLLPDILSGIARTAPDQGRVYGGRTLAERRAERRERFLDAGLELFGTIGYAATTIEALCAEAGLNPRYFYEQHGTREGLLLAVYNRHVGEVLAIVLDALETAHDDPRERLECGLRAFIEATLADERAARINYFELVGVSRELEAHRREVLRAYANMIAAQTERYEAPRRLVAGDRRLAAMALAGATDGLLIDWLSGDRIDPLESIVKTLVDIFAPAS